MPELLGETPVGGVVTGERNIGNFGPDHFHRNAIAPQNAVVKLACSHLAGGNQFPVKNMELHPSQHVGALVKHGGARGQRAAHLPSAWDRS